MTDYFALLGESRRPWLEPASIKETYHRLSREWHPDQRSARGLSETPPRFAELNQAQQTLSEPKGRLRHLLALEYPEVSVSGPSVVPPQLADLMFPVQALLGQADAFLNRRRGAANELSRALLANEGFVLQEQVEEKLVALEHHLGVLENELLAFDRARWPGRPADAAAVLLGFYHGFSYLTRWTAQFREQVFELAG